MTEVLDQTAGRGLNPLAPGGGGQGDGRTDARWAATRSSRADPAGRQSGVLHLNAAADLRAAPCSPSLTLCSHTLLSHSLTLCSHSHCSLSLTLPNDSDRESIDFFRDYTQTNVE